METLRLRRLLGIQDARDEEVESRLFREDVEEDAVASPASPEFAVSESEATSVFSPMARGKRTSPVVNKARSPAKRDGSGLRERYFAVWLSGFLWSI